MLPVGDILVWDLSNVLFPLAFVRYFRGNALTTHQQKRHTRTRHPLRSRWPFPAAITVTEATATAGHQQSRAKKSGLEPRGIAPVTRGLVLNKLPFNPGRGVDSL